MQKPTEQRPVTIEIELDTRRQKEDDTYPVKLRVYDPERQTLKRYATIFNFTKKEFKSIWETQKPRKEHREHRLQLQALETRANDVVNSLPEFNFTDFERAMFNRVAGKVLNVNFYFQKTVENKKERGQISTAQSYRHTLDCLLRFQEKELKKSPVFGKYSEKELKPLNFRDISPNFLSKFENYCTQTEGKTLATTGIMLRNMRAVFNTAIREKTIPQSLYPFGKGKFQIKKGQGNKRALSREQIQTLFNGTPLNEYEAKAKAFWFLSYLCNGANFRDILKFRYKDLSGDVLTFVRAKTERSTSDNKPIKVFLHPFALEVIQTYGNPDKAPENLIFDVLSPDLNPVDEHRAIKGFTRYVNTHFRSYAHRLGIEEPVSAIWARHSFSTQLLRRGKSIKLIQESLGHTDIRTTMNYLSDFEDKDRKEIRNDLLD